MSDTVDKIMSKAQVFASAWSIAGGRFDTGQGIEEADREKFELRAMIAAALAAPQPKGLFIDMIAAEGPEFFAEMAAIGEPQPVKQALTIENIRAVNGIVHSDGNIFFTNLDQLNRAIEGAKQ